MRIFNKTQFIAALLIASLSGGCSPGTGLFFTGPDKHHTGKGDSAFTWYKVQSIETKEGDGARVKRLFPNKNHQHHDPFVLMDEFFVKPGSGFPKHKHKGFEAITYMLDGAFHHKDNLGYDSVVQAGGAQRFSSGKGLIHSEMPGNDSLSHGLQLWIRLPDSLQQTVPSYQQVSPSDIPVTEKKGLKIRTISENNTPVSVQANIRYQHYIFSENRDCSIEVPDKHQGFLYLLKGNVRLDTNKIKAGSAIFFDTTPAGKISLKATKGTEFVFITGKPHNEKIKLKGSFVE